MVEPAVVGSTDAHYARFGILPGDIVPAEDGMRTDGGRGSWEWWYFDAYLDDGAKVVIGFYTKDFTAPNRPLRPVVTIDLDLPDGRSIHRRAVFGAGEFTASRSTCDVRIAANSFRGDLSEYSISATIEDVSLKIRLTSRTEPWRPETGVLLFGADERNYFAWLPSVPSGDVTATYRVGDREIAASGSGYHDHNWGNCSLLPLINNWYWGRGVIGRYTFISAWIVSEKRYGYQPGAVFMLARDGRVIADDGERVAFSREQIEPDPVTGTPVADVVRYEYTDGPARFVLTYRRDATIVQQPLIDLATPGRRMLARIARFDGAYLRFRGILSLERFEGDELVERHEGEALWELMYFGRHEHEGG